MPLTTEVMIEDTAPPGHTEAVAEAFKRVDLVVEVEAAWIRKSADVLPWVVKIAVDGTLAGFFGALGVDAYSTFKRLVHEVREARTGAGDGTGSIDVSDSDNTHLILSDSLPDEALDALRDLDWSEKRGEYLVWKPDRNEWVDPLKRVG